MSLFNRFILVSMFVVLSSCGNSPLYNHKNEGDLGKNSQVTDVRDCSLKFQKAQYCGNVQWGEANSPHMGGDSKFTLRLWPADSPAALQDPDATVFVSLFMPSMGHGSEPVTLVKSAPGFYEVTNVRFFMGGDWDLKVQLRGSGNQVLDEAKLTFDIHD